MSLATLDDVKRILDVTDNDRDGAIQDVLDAANGWVKRTTRFEQVAGTYVDIHQQVQLGTTVGLTHRPVDSITLTEMWAVSGVWAADSGWGAPGWTPVIALLLDPMKGLVAFPNDVWGADPYYGEQIISEPAPWYGWRSLVVPAVRITYVTAPQVIPSEVRHAAAALAAYWVRRERAGASKSVQIGLRLREDFMDTDVPEWVNAMVAPFRDEPAAMWA